MARFEALTEVIWEDPAGMHLSRPQIAKVLRWLDQHPRRVPKRTEAEKLEDLCAEQLRRGGSTTGIELFKWFENNGVKAGN